jgi:hypothetical protein
MLILSMSVLLHYFHHCHIHRISYIAYVFGFYCYEITKESDCNISDVKFTVKICVSHVYYFIIFISHVYYFMNNETRASYLGVPEFKSLPGDWLS